MPTLYLFNRRLLNYYHFSFSFVTFPFLLVVTIHISRQAFLSLDQCRLEQSLGPESPFLLLVAIPLPYLNNILLAHFLFHILFLCQLQEGKMQILTLLFFLLRESAKRILKP